MCGIIGQYSFTGKIDETIYLEKCLSAMQYRGPDEQKTWNNGMNYFAGFARLAIRDTSSNASQPMLSEEGEYCISFNGEIYNTEYLRTLIKPFRKKFQSSSDTEILLYALIHLGIQETLHIADGIFAFAFYSRKNNTLILARDRMGVKPLYYGIHAKGLVYSSEYAHIVNHTFFKNEKYDASAIYNYLFLGYMAEGNAIIHKTYFLPHGHFLKIENGKVDLNPYYEYGKNLSSQREFVLDEILSTAVSSQLVSDVPIGTFMSGGTDSTLVSYFANQHQHFKAFTLGINESKMDEMQAASAYAEKFAIPHFCKNIAATDLEPLIEEHVKAFSEPFADYSSLPTLMLSKFVKKHITVALSGDGADEMFWGYPRNIRAKKLIQLYQNNPFQKKVQLLTSKINNRHSVELKRHWKTAHFLDYYYSMMGITGALAWLPKIMNVKPEKSFFLQKHFKNTFQLSVDDQMNEVRKLEMDLHLQRILLKVDRAGMFHSLEIRVPFLSNAMLDYSNQITASQNIQNDMGKMNIKNSLAAKAGSSLVFTEKKGFGIPIDEWMRGNLKQHITDTILNMPNHLKVHFNFRNILKMLDKFFSGKENTGWFVWALYILSRWDRQHKNTRL